MTAPETLVELAERFENATAEETGALLREAFEAIHGPKPDRILGGSPQLDAWLKLFNPFYVLLRAGGFLDAAMMLVPEGCVWWMPFPNDARVGDADGHTLNPLPQQCATPALALGAAALKVRAQAKDSK